MAVEATYFDLPSQQLTTERGSHPSRGDGRLNDQMNDDLLTNERQRQAAYRAGAEAAQQAFMLDDSDTAAHLFSAANLGRPNDSRAKS